MRMKKKLERIMTAIMKSGINEFACDKETYGVKDGTKSSERPYQALYNGNYDAIGVKIFLARDIDWFRMGKKYSSDHEVIVVFAPRWFQQSNYKAYLVYNSNKEMYPLIDSDPDVEALMKRIYIKLQARHEITRGERMGNNLGVLSDT